MAAGETTGHKFAGLVPEMLIREIKARRCVLFVGAGMSARATGKDGASLPTWKALLQKMVDWCVDHRVQLRGKPADFFHLIDKGRLLIAAQELQLSLGSNLNPCLSDILYSGSAKPSEAHRLLCRISWVAAFTSNYDGLIEGGYAVESEGIVPPIFSADGVNQAIDSLRNSRFFVFKVHGDVNIPGSIILGNRDYSRLLYLSPAYRSFLETIFSTYTVLFLGFGGADPDLDGIIDRLSTIFERGIGQHFILLPEDEFTPIERLRLLEDKRLDCITYQKDDTHSQVLEFLKAVTQRVTEGAAAADPFKGRGKAPRAFVAGHHSQLALLRRVASIARKVGFEVWFAEEKIQVGSPIVDEISKAIDQADCFIVVLSEEATRSQWVTFEVGRAWGARKRIFPIRVGDAPVPSDLSAFLYLQVSGPDLSPDEEGRIQENLTRLLQGLRGN
jgi:hypothetical protein